MGSQPQKYQNEHLITMEQAAQQEMKPTKKYAVMRNPLNADTGLSEDINCTLIEKMLKT